MADVAGGLVILNPYSSSNPSKVQVGLNTDRISYASSIPYKVQIGGTNSFIGMQQVTYYLIRVRDSGSGASPVYQTFVSTDKLAEPAGVTPIGSWVDRAIVHSWVASAGSVVSADPYDILPDLGASVHFLIDGGHNLVQIGNKISAIIDQSPLSNSFTQGNVSQRVSSSLSSMNGRPAFSFANASETTYEAVSPTAFDLTTYTFGFVWSPTSYGAANYMCPLRIGSTNGAAIMTDAAGNVSIILPNVGWYTLDTFIAKTELWTVRTSVVGNWGFEVWRNTTKVYSQWIHPKLTPFGPNVFLGHYMQGFYGMDGLISTAFGVNTTLSDAAIAAVQGKLITKYGIT